MVALPLLAARAPETTEARQLLALALGGGAAGLLALPRLPRPHGAAGWCVAGLAAAALASALASPFGRLAAGDALAILGALGAGLAVASIAAARAGALAIAVAGVAGAVALLPPRVASEILSRSRAAGPYADAETLGLALAPAAAAGLAATLARRSPLLGLFSLLAAAGVAGSLSRGAGMALAAGTLAALAGAGRRALGLGLALLVCGGLLGLAVLAATGRLDLVRSRLHLREERADVTPPRSVLLRLGLAAAARHPLLGSGPGSFPHLAPAAVRQARSEGRLPAASVPWPRVQNDAVEIAATLGVPAAGLLVAVFALGLRRAWRRRGQVEDAAALAALGAVAVSALLHPPLETAAGRLAAALALGVALRPEGGSRPRSGPLAPAGALLAAGLLLWRAWPPDPGGGLALARAVELTLEHEHDLALPRWRAYALAAPPTAPAQVRLARAEARAGDPPAAEAILRGVLDDWPEDAAARLALGETLLTMGRDDEALVELDRVRAGKLAARARDLERRVQQRRASGAAVIPGAAPPDL